MTIQQLTSNQPTADVSSGAPDAPISESLITQLAAEFFRLYQSKIRKVLTLTCRAINHSLEIRLRHSQVVYLLLCNKRI